MTITGISCPEPNESEDETLLAAFTAHLRAVEGKALRTARDYAHDARGLVRFLRRDFPEVALRDVEPFHLIAYLVDQEDRGRSAVTRRRSIFAIRSWLAFLTDAPAGKTAAHLVRLPKASPPKTGVFSESDVRRVLAYGATQESLRGQLAHVITATVWATGLRCSELAGLRIADVDLHGRRLQVIGKGDRQRRVPIPHVLVEILTVYLAQIRPQLPGDEFLFSNPHSQPGGPHHGKMSIWTLPRLVSQHCQDAGVTGKSNLHQWRHTYATTVLRRSGDLHTVQRLLGHSSMQTTLRYLHLVDDDLRDAVDRAFTDDED